MKKSSRILMIGIIGIVAVVSLFVWNRNKQLNQQRAELSEAERLADPEFLESQKKIVETEEFEMLQDLPQQYSLKAELSGESGIESFGVADAGYLDGSYLLTATFQNLPDPEEGFFYEGWVVREEPRSAVSTGVVEKSDVGIYINFFSSTTDYSDHNRYVLTLEPDDGDPEPAAHVVEGSFEQKLFQRVSPLPEQN